MWDDLKYALRSLRQSPAFTAVAVGVLALGIGASTAVFSIVDAVVLRGLPFEDHDRLVAVLEHDPKNPQTFGGGSTTPQTYLDWRRLQTSFEGLAAVGSAGYEIRTVGGEPADASALRVTWEFFGVLRTHPMLGRPFSASDEVDGNHRVVILSHGFWQRQFGGAPHAVGQTIDLSGTPWRVVGVMPEGFQYPVGAARQTDLYVPLKLDPEDRTRGSGKNYSYSTIGRLKRGVSLAQAGDEMVRVAAALDRQYPTWTPGWTARVVTLHDKLVGRVRPWMLMLLGAVALVLLIACANVANLMLARATVRGRETSLRAALGATRWQLVRATLVEGLALACTSAALGVGLAWGSVRILQTWVPATLPRVSAIGLDLRVLGAAVVMAIVTGVVFSLVPAIQSSRPNLTTALADGGRTSGTGPAGRRLRGALVVVEMALAVTLLVGAGLFTGSFVRLVQIDPGFDYQNLLALNVGLRFDFRKMPPDLAPRSRAYVERMLESVGRVPGVEAASAVTGGLPLTGSWSRQGIELPGRAPIAGEDGSIDVRRVTPNYLSVLRVPLIRGRHLSDLDRETSDPVVVINDVAARRYWPGQDALGRRVKIGDKDMLVVGIVGSIRHLGPEEPARQEAYLPIAQNRIYSAALVLRTSRDPLDVLPAVKAAIWSVNRDQRLTAPIVTLDGYMDRLIAQRRFNMAILALLGVLGLAIATAGVYGVMAYLVAQRRSEIGVRMALGATPRSVVSMVIRNAALLLLLGLTVGGIGAWYLSASVRTFLFQIEPTDIRIHLTALAVLAASGLAASAIPARRAATLDPLVALRRE